MWRKVILQCLKDADGGVLCVSDLSWLLSGTVAVKPQVVHSVHTVEESIGLKKSFYEAPDTAALPDTESQLKSMLFSANDECRVLFQDGRMPF